MLAAVGFLSIYRTHSFDFSSLTNLFSFDKEKTVEQVGDFSQVDKEFDIDTAVKVMGYKTVVAKHSGSGQKMIIVDSGRKKLLSKDDLKNDNVKYKLEDLCKKYAKNSAEIDSIEIIDRGYMNTYGKTVPYVKVNIKMSKFPNTNFTGIVSVVDEDANNQRLIVSINDKKHYSQLITTEFYKSVKGSKIR